MDVERSSDALPHAYQSCYDSAFGWRVCYINKRLEGGRRERLGLIYVCISGSDGASFFLSSHLYPETCNNPLTSAAPYCFSPSFIPSTFSPLSFHLSGVPWLSLTLPPDQELEVASYSSCEINHRSNPSVCLKGCHWGCVFCGNR